jgi:hypothetical protein
MFNLTRGFLKKAVEENIEMSTKLKNENIECLCLVKVENLIDLKEEDAWLLTINDGETSLDVNLDYKLWHMLNSSTNINKEKYIENSEMKIQKGSIILILNYCFMDLELVLSKRDMKNMLTINKCFVVGFLLETINNQTQIESLPLKKNCKTYTISQITINLNNQNWSFKAKLLKQSQEKEFVNKLSGTNGKYVRLQFGDSSGIIEMVGFNEEIQKIQNCIDDKFYVVTNADVKYSKGTTQAWEDTGSSAIELVVNKKTFIQEYEEEKEKLFTIFVKKTEKTQERKKINNLLALKEIFLKNDGDLVTTICVIESIEKIKEITPKNKSPINIRNFFVADQTLNSVKVAVWGKQAEEFNFKEGDILLLSRVKISHFNGLTLSIQKDTIIRKIDDHSVEEANELVSWLREKEMISSSLKRKLSIT